MKRPVTGYAQWASPGVWLAAHGVPGFVFGEHAVPVPQNDARNIRRYGAKWHLNSQAKSSKIRHSAHDLSDVVGRTLDEI